MKIARVVWEAPVVLSGSQSLKAALEALSNINISVGWVVRDDKNFIGLSLTVNEDAEVADDVLLIPRRQIVDGVAYLADAPGV